METYGDTVFDEGDPRNDTGNTNNPKVRMQERLPNIPVSDPRYYVCTAKGHHMTRIDGKPLKFLPIGDIGIHRADNKHDIKYFEREIGDQHPNLRRATPEEIKQLEYHLDPKGAIAKEIRPQVEREAAQKHFSTMRERLIKQREAGKNQLTDEQIDELTTVEDSQSDLLSGVGGEIHKTAIESGTGKIYPAAQPQEDNSRFFSRSIVGTGKLPNAADSNSVQAKK
jgi:hypothetical protein